MSVLIIFGKSFVFTKISKISKTVLPCSGDLVAGQTSRMPSVVSLHRSFSRLTGGSKIRREKDLENFQKFWVFSFLATQFGGLFTSGSFNRELTQSFCSSLHDFLAGGISSREKYLDKFFKNFVSSVSRLILATCTRHGTVVKNACFVPFG